MYTGIACMRTHRLTSSGLVFFIKSSKHPLTLCREDRVIVTEKSASFFLHSTWAQPLLPLGRSEVAKSVDLRIL